MIHPTDNHTAPPLAVRDGQGAPVTCSACGCRLKEADGVFLHFGGLSGRDARGCRVECAEESHDRLGRVVGVLTA